jgi:hypothetical protein
MMVWDATADDSINSAFACQHWISATYQCLIALRGSSKLHISSSEIFRGTFGSFIVPLICSVFYKNCNELY